MLGPSTSFRAVTLVPTLLAFVIGIGLGVRWGGRVDELLRWRPVLPSALLGGVGVLFVLDALPWSGPLVTFVAVVATAAVLGFAVLNIRTGGMVLVAAGTGLNLLVTILNWGTPVSGSALVSAGVVEEAELGSLTLNGGRALSDGAVLGFLGDAIPLPWGHVISVGDLLVLAGIALVTSSVVRRFEVGRGGAYPRLQARTGPNDYRNALDALGRGPAPRRGPGLHPSRLPDGRRRRRPARQQGRQQGRQDGRQGPHQARPQPRQPAGPRRPGTPPR